MSKKRPFVPWALVSIALMSSVVVAFVAVNAGAADPSEGTVSTEQPMLAWQGEHYDVGQSKLADACLLPTNTVCDHFDLTVDIDPSHWESADGGVEVKIAWEDEADDFDLWVYDSDGALVGSSANGGTSSERVLIEKASGTYRVEVNPWDVIDSSYEGGAHVESRADVPGPEGGEVPAEPLFGATCEDGLAGPFPCDSVDLEAFLPSDTIGGGELNDIWGWTDPETGREYALIGRAGGTSFVDVTEPQAPKYLGNLPSHQSVGGQPIETIFATWHDVKVYADHAFIVSEEPAHGVQIFDLTKLRGVEEEQTFTEDGHYSFLLDGIASFADTDPTRTLSPPDNAHNIAINEDSGFAYAIGTSTCGGGGPHMIDIRDPKNPTFAGCVSEDGYTHDSQCVNYREGDPDPSFAGREICFNSNEDTLTIVDVTDKDNPEQLARVPYDGAAYTHQSWLTEDRKYVLVDDELDEQGEGGKTRTYIFNVENLRNPVYVDTYQGVTESIDHNQYIKGDRAYQANYRSGLRVLDVNRVDSGILEEVGYFDIYPEDDAAEFNGAWSNYPYYDSGIIVVSGIEQGLFVLRPQTGGSEEKAASETAPQDGAGSNPGTTPGSGPGDRGERGRRGASRRPARSRRPRVGRRVRVNRRGVARVKLACPRQRPTANRALVYRRARCKGRLVLRTRGKRIARRRFALPAGKRGVRRVRVRRRAAVAYAGKRKRGAAVIRGRRADRRKVRAKQRVRLVFARR